MYKHTLRIQDTQLATAQTLPRNTSAVGNAGPQSAGGLLGGAEVVMVAASAVTIADAKSVSLGLEDSADGISFAAVPITCKRTVSGGARTWKTGEVLARLPVPSDCRELLRAVLSTDDAAAAGTVDVIFDYLPR